MLTKYVKGIFIINFIYINLKYLKEYQNDCSLRIRIMSPSWWVIESRKKHSFIIYQQTLFQQVEKLTTKYWKETSILTLASHIPSFF